MKRKYNILLLSLLLVCSSCQEDKSSGNIFVDPITLHLTYDVYGEQTPFTNPLEITMINVSEQITSKFKTDTWGKLLLDELLPGEYTINVNGSLTADEALVISGGPYPQGVTLEGFVANVNLRLNKQFTLDIPISKQNISTLIFKELYYCGSRTPADGRYRNDIFYSIYNNASWPIDLNNIYIANAENLGSSTAPLWPGETQGKYKNMYAQAIWKIVGNNTATMIDPGQTVVIATMAAPHNTDPKLNPKSPVDLSHADYEAYCEDPENSYTNYPAPNMKLAFWPDYGYLWRISVFGQGMALIEATAEEFKAFETVILPEQFWTPGESTEYWYCKKIPYDFILDAVDLLKNSNDTPAKRFNQPLDSGFTTVAGTYVGKSVIRKVDKVVDGITRYKDTNNSTYDFEINDKPLSK